MKPKSCIIVTLAVLAVLGCSDTASAQQPQLTVTPATTAANPLAFNNVPAGGISPSQTVTVGTQNSVTSTVIVQVPSTYPWLQVSPGASVNVPATLSVSCNTTLLNSGTYTGSFTITVDGAPQDQVTVYVSLTVSGISALSATPPNLSFTAQAGATTGTPTSAQVQISSSAQPENFNLQVNYLQPSGNWVLLSSTSGSTTGAPITVSVNPSVIAATQYPATFSANIIAASTTSADSVVIGVQLNITSAATLSITPTNLQPFLYQAGTTTDPPPQQLTLATNEGPLTYSIQESPQPVSWLAVSPLGGTASTTPSTVTLAARPYEAGETPGTYTTNLIVTPSGESALPPIPVTLFVSANPLLRLSSNNLSFNASFAGSPVTQSVIVSSTGAAQLGFTVSSSQSWLTAGASASTTPATLTVQVNPANLSIQTYTGTITLTPTNGDNYTETITVTLNITSPSQLVAAPNALLFSYEIGKAQPSTQSIEITSTGQPLEFMTSTGTSNCGPNWLTASPIAGSSTTTISVSVVTAGLTAGACSGVVNLNYQSGTGPAVLSIPVTLAVSTNAELSINMAPGFGLSTVALINGQFEQQISLTSTDPNTPVDFTANVTNVGGGAWLGIAGNNTGLTPENLTIQFTPGALSIPGTYTGTIVIGSSTLGTAQLTLQVMLTVTTATTVTVTPSSLTFSENQGATPLAAQTLSLTTSPGTATYTAVINYLNSTGWLQISPNSGNASGQMTVTVPQNTLSVGQYNAQIIFSFQNSATTTLTVNVTLNVLPQQVISVSPQSMSFTYEIGGTAPPTQTLAITSSSGSATVKVVPNSAGWLAVNSSGGATPQNITVSVNPQGLTAQTYAGSISISDPGVLATPISIPVSFTVSAAPGPQPLLIINNATGVSSSIAPGEEIAIKGNFLGPATPANGTLFSVNSNNTVSNTLAGVQVLFDNIPGTPIFVSQNQINVMVPYEINGRVSTNMVVSSAGGSSSPFPLAVAQAAPGLFTNNFTGSGQVAAINQDHSYNGAAGAGVEAAPRGSVISLYGTGGGQTNPPSTTGSVTPVPQSASQLLNISNVTATVGGVPATVTFAGAAPGLVTGVIQVNVLIPTSVTPGTVVPVFITVDGIQSPFGTTIVVQ